MTAGEQRGEEVDVVVVGSGAAGLSAAVVSAFHGLRVLVLEKTAYYGGSTAVSGGAVWVPENAFLASLNLSDSRAEVMTYLKETVGPHLDVAMMGAFLDHAPRMLDFMQQHTALQFGCRPLAPDYYADLPGAKDGGRVLDPLPFDGRELGLLFEQLRPPYASFMAFGGLMVARTEIDSLLSAHRSWSALRHSLGLLGRYAMDRLRHSRGTRLLMGNALAARLLASCVRQGVQLRRRCAVTALLREGGRVTGVQVNVGDRATTIRARRGVVLAAGGFAASASWRRDHVPHADVHRSMAPEGDTGDGIDMGLKTGAALAGPGAGPVFWAPVSVARHVDGSEIPFPHLIMDRAKPGLIAVNAQGCRFVNEASSYHDFVRVMHASHGQAPCIPAFLVCDAAFLFKYGLGLARPGFRTHGALLRCGYLVRSDTVAGLAARLGLPADALAQTVARHNTYAQQGHDPDFGKGSTSYHRYLGDASHRPNPCLGPIARAPFYAVCVVPGDIGSSRGLAGNAQAQVLDGHGRVIEGLYACGNDLNSVMAGTYPAAGITLGPALTFGFIAGEQLAGVAPTSSTSNRSDGRLPVAPPSHASSETPA